MKYTIRVTILLLITIFSSCSEAPSTTSKKISPLEKRLIAQGLVNIQNIDPTIMVDLKYSGKENFLNQDVYGQLNNCYLQKEAADKLQKAHQYLKKIDPDLRFLVYDGVRPRSVQYKMWQVVKGSELQKYVANPVRGSIHNYGAAVDLTIVRLNKNMAAGYEILHMGTDFDYFGDLAQPRYEKKFLKEGKLTHSHIENRKLLRKVMLKAGFKMINVEWWHFNAFTVKKTKSRYKIVE